MGIPTLATPVTCRESPEAPCRSHELRPLGKGVQKHAFQIRFLLISFLIFERKIFISFLFYHIMPSSVFEKPLIELVQDIISDIDPEVSIDGYGK